MGRYTLNDFAAKTVQRYQGHGLLELESDRMMEVNLNGNIWIKTGVMVAYLGQIKFAREGVFEQGIGQFFKKAISGEGARLTKATGQGKLYLADTGKKITILELVGDESIFVNGNDIMAFESTLTTKVTMMKKMAAVLSGGLFNVKLQGAGLLAITTHYEPMTLRVVPGQPVFTDPNATIAWSGNLSPQFKTDVSLKTFLARGSGESMQMMFEGDGFVVVQPYEEVYLQASRG